MIKKILLPLSTILLLSACNKTAKKNLGLEENLPDEFQVKKAKPLEVPPHFDPSYKPVAKKPAQEVQLQEVQPVTEEEVEDSEAKTTKKTTTVGNKASDQVASPAQPEFKDESEDTASDSKESKVEKKTKDQTLENPTQPMSDTVEAKEEE